MANHFLESLFNKVTQIFRSVERNRKEKNEDDERLKADGEKRERGERERDKKGR